MARSKRKVARPSLPIQRQLRFASEGRYFDLAAIFKYLNARYFRNSIQDYSIVWGRRRKLPPKEYFVFGTIQEETRVIRIHPLLDQEFVPLWFLEYVVYHEMLHSVVADRFDKSGRRIIHHEAFNKRERLFGSYRRAKKWEAENLERFLR